MDDALFELHSTAPSASAANRASKYDPISEEEIEKIRSAFANANIIDQEKRQHFIQSTLGREISSLSAVLSHEVPRIIYGLNDIIFAAKSSTANERSAWDDREEDTWIDKL